MNDNGGTALESAWTLTATGNPVTDPATLTGPGAAGNADVVSGAGFDAGTYDLSESTGPANYTASTWSCTGGQTGTEAKVTVALGADIACTITNDDDAPKLTLNKVVVNDNGGTALESAWTLTATGNPVTDPATLTGPGAAGNTDVVSGAGFDAGTYDLSESTGPANYTASTWSCTGGQTGTQAKVTVALGADITCTITNNDQVPSLTLIKTVTNDNGGSAVATNWILTADGTGSNDISGDGGAISDGSLLADTFALSESTGPAGYTAGSWSCVGGTQNGANITLALGQSATCTINNDDSAPKLTLNKVVVNDNGGTALESAWTLTATGNPVTDPATLTGPGAAGNADVVSGAGFDAGTYDLSESTGPANYTASTWSCTGGQTGTEAKVTVALGADIACTITNDDDAPKLTLNKVVVNDNGGTALESAWTLTATGNPVTDPATLTGPGAAGNTDVVSGAGFDAGTYDLSESTGPANYTASTWSCTGGQTGTEAKVTVALGADITCTITNEDDAPKLTLNKVVVGGTSPESAFTLTATGNPVTSPATLTGPGAAGNTDVVSGATFDAGTYDLSETGPAGYTASDWSCTGGQTGTQAKVTVALGDDITCTITNTRDQGSIKVIKYHDLNGNGASEDAEPALNGWDFFVDLDGNGSQNGSEPTGTTAGGELVFANLDTGTYRVCEVLKTGWVNSDPGTAQPCKGSISVTKNGTTTVELGNYQRTKIQINKTVSGGAIPTGTVFQFQIREGASVTSDGTIIANGSITGPDGTLSSNEWNVVSGQQYPLDPGTDYQLCELVTTGYTPSFVVLGQYGTAWFHPSLDTNDPNTSTVDNSYACYDLPDIQSGDGGDDNTIEIDINNEPGGMARTIGYWKNWTSCDGNGNQAPVLDQTIANYADDSNGNGRPDIRIGNLYIEDNPATAGKNEACMMAVDLLDKRPVGNPAKVGDKAKAASDPVYNSVAQLVAYELNQLNPDTNTGACAKADSAAVLMQRFLVYIDFKMNGTTNSVYNIPGTKQEQAQVKANLLYLAGVLDDYNNNSISCGGALTLPNPNKGNTATLWVNFLPAWPAGSS